MSLNEQLFRYFRQRRGQWVSALAIAKRAGLLSSRTRISECRRSPWNLTVQNRQRYIRRGPRLIRISEYRCL